MKKFFLFAAAIIAAMTVNAAVWDIAENPANTTMLFNALNPVIANATVNQKQTGDNPPKDYVEVVNDQAGVEASVDFEHFPMKITYTNSKDVNKKFFRIYPTYFQIDAKGTKLIITCNVGDEISFYSKSYTKDLAFFITGADQDVIEFKSNEVDKKVSVKATETEVIFDTKIPAEDQDHSSYAQSYQFVKFEVAGGSQAIENVESTEKAVKYFENGQLVIIKNGVRYNALGAQL
jgi:hypothetical protein